MKPHSAGRPVFDQSPAQLQALREQFGAASGDETPLQTLPRRKGGTPPLPRVRPRWKKKRWWIATALLILGLCALTVAWVRGHQTRLVVQNTAGTPLPPVVLIACGQQHRVPELAPDESYVWVLADNGEAGAIHVESPGDPHWTWDGGWLKPRAGDRVILRIAGPGNVEPAETGSIWAGIW